MNIDISNTEALETVSDFHLASKNNNQILEYPECCIDNDKYGCL